MYDTRNKRIQNEHSSGLNAEQSRAAWHQLYPTEAQPTFARITGSLSYVSVISVASEEEF